MSSFKERIIGAAKLDTRIYEEVEADKSALSQAMGVVVLSSIAAGLAGIGKGGLGVILVGVFASLIGWFIWAYIAYAIGTKFLPEPQTSADLGQLLRTTGFSSSPGLIRIIGIVPGLATLIFAIAGVWMLITMVVAVRQALDYRSTLRAVAVCIVGWIIQALALAIFFSLFGGVRPPS